MTIEMIHRHILINEYDTRLEMWLSAPVELAKFYHFESYTRLRIASRQVEAPTLSPDHNSSDWISPKQKQPISITDSLKDKSFTD